jgi:hypothetical protein
VPSPTDPHESNFEDESSRLDEGLRSCRAVVSGYRALLAGGGSDDRGQIGFNEADGPREASARI